MKTTLLRREYSEYDDRTISNFDLGSYRTLLNINRSNTYILLTFYSILLAFLISNLLITIADFSSFVFNLLIILFLVILIRIAFKEVKEIGDFDNAYVRMVNKIELEEHMNEVKQHVKQVIRKKKVKEKTEVN